LTAASETPTSLGITVTFVHHAGAIMSENRVVHYEFSEGENITIARAARLGLAWGIVSIVVGSLASLVGLVTLAQSPLGLIQLLSGGTSIAIGIIFIGVARSLREVVDTEGNDVDHVMAALHKLGTAFLIQIILTGVAFVLGFIIGVAVAA
jgi:hypothetical protein